MNKTKIFLTLTLLFSITFNMGFSQNKLTVTIKNIQQKIGTIKLGLFDNPKAFPNKGKAFKEATVKVTGNTTTYTFNNVPSGEYAIALFHDENSDGKCNFTLGIPNEGFGFSNNVKAKFSAPDFKQASFSLNGSKNIQININHF